MEYVLIFPLVILCVFLLIYIGLVYCQQAILQSVVTENAQNWSFLWGYDAEIVNSKHGVINREVYQSEGLYWHIFSGANRKEKIVRDVIVKEVEKKNLLKSSQEVQVEVTYKNYILYQKLELFVTAGYPSPLKGFSRSFGLPDAIILQAYGEAVLDDPKEFIHNVDYLLQIYEETGAKHWIQEKCKPLVDSLQKVKEAYK